ncbi:MAG TPA: mechanosensitive ion channel family protein [Bryobacteraceae bacterium]|nr:mechanosensitive ion channel family protein [Bryobacteraceae bacterium]
MNVTKRLKVCLACCTVLAGLAMSADPPPAPVRVRAADVLKHLEQTISWYRNINAVERSSALANDVVLRDTARRTSAEVLQHAFDFARAQAAFVEPEQPAARANGSRPGAPGRNMDRVAARAAERIAKLDARLEGLDRAAEKATARSRPIILAQRKQALAELNLAKQIQGSVQSLVAFMGASASTSDALVNRVDQLEHSVPEAMRAPQQRSTAAPAVAAVPASAAPVFRPESAGMFGLATQLYTLARTRRQLTQAVNETDALLAYIRQIRTPLGAEMRNSIRRSDAIGAASGSDNPEQLAAAQREIEALSARFKQISTVLVPLREEGILVETSRGNLLEWRTALDSRSGVVSGYLVMRGVLLAVGIGILLIISEVWRRMTFRYARDARRRRQFLVMRRIVVGFAIALVVILGFISEVGSLATYAGFLTAGLAVALQNPIASVVAYFFLIGRYGLRVGDRVTIAGVTGDIIEIGLVRIYVMELTGSGANLDPTGRIVTFSNSVLFQPAALFKKMPGADYVWHTATLTLAPECDARFAETKLMGAVESVYGEYRDRIEQQHALFERSVDMKVSPPEPQGGVRFTDAGLEFTVRYPAEAKDASTVDERVMRALHIAIDSEPNLALARTGQPKLQATV